MREPRAPTAAPLETERLLICEGRDEVGLVLAMIAADRAPKMDVRNIGDPGNGLGIDGLRVHLQSLYGLTGFERISSIAIFADNDDDPAKCLTKICRAIESANQDDDVSGIFSVPTHANVKSTTSKVAVTIITSPGNGVVGCLETMLIDVLNKLYPSAMQCVDQLVSCAGINDIWSVSKLDKARVRAAVSILCKRNPAIPLSILWKNHPEIIPVSDDRFNDLSEALFSF